MTLSIRTSRLPSHLPCDSGSRAAPWRGLTLSAGLALLLVGCVADLDGAEPLDAADEARLSGSPTSEVTSELGTAATCTVHIGLTSRSGNIITGYGSQASCGTSGVSYLTIQRSRWWGWEDLATSTVIGSGHDVYVHYNCSGTGTHEFRTIHTAKTIGGSYLFKESNHITASC